MTVRKCIHCGQNREYWDKSDTLNHNQADEKNQNQLRESIARLYVLLIYDLFNKLFIR